MKLGQRGLFFSELAALALIVAGHVVLLTRLLHTAPYFDESVYLASLDDLRHGAALGRQVFTSQMPGFYVLLRVIGMASGVSLTGVRLGIVAIDAIGAVFAFLLGRRLAGPYAGLLAAGLLAIAPRVPELGGRIFADAPAMALALAALWLAATRRPVAAGTLFAAALLVKLSAVTALPGLVALLATGEGRVRSLTRAAAGAAALLALTALVFVRDLHGIWTGAFSYHYDTRNIAGDSARHDLESFFALKTPFLWLTLAAVAVSPLVWRRVWPLWLWPAAALVFMATYQPLRDNHILVVPYAFAPAVAVTLVLAAQRLPVKFLLAGLAAVVLLLAGGWVQQLHRVRLDFAPEDPNVVAAAAKVRSLTAAGDIVVADQPYVAVLAERRVPPQLVDTANSRFDSGSLTVAGVLRAIDTDPHVRVAVAGRAFATRPKLVAGLRRRFAQRFVFGTVTVFANRR